MRIVMMVDQPIIFVLDEISLAEPRAECSACDAA
jgi:hypothetical protein